MGNKDNIELNKIIKKSENSKNSTCKNIEIGKIEKPINLTRKKFRIEKLEKSKKLTCENLKNLFGPEKLFRKICNLKNSFGENKTHKNLINLQKNKFSNKIRKKSNKFGNLKDKIRKISRKNILLGENSSTRNVSSQKSKLLNKDLKNNFGEHVLVINLRNLKNKRQQKL